ncbi:MAG: DNA circularization N-terminal domain-containing protein, partial [Candidatus Diapherotrites archaeon]|nr:DNA circularization N-terminal domain-containing protein [Candidatus Diapherotrites archaeon]
ITGDGKSFSPEWVQTTRSIEFNTAEFVFPNVPGSLLDRREQKGQRFTLEVFFQGTNHLDESDDFIESAVDKRFWTLIHPFYGKMFVQPLSLGIDDTKRNVTKFTIPVIETITDVNPKTRLIADDKIVEDTQILNLLSAENFENSADLEVQDVNNMKELTNQYFSNTNSEIADDEDGQNFFNKYNSALSAIGNALEDSGAAITAMIDLIQTPATFNQSIESRLEILQKNYDSLQSFVDLEAQTVELVDKFIYEVSQNAVLCGMCIASSHPFDDEDYENRNQVSDVVSKLLINSNLYFKTLDDIQSGDGNNPDDFVANPNTMLSLDNLVNFTMANLFSIGLDAKQERFLTVEDDTDFVNLSHRLYGPKKHDAHIDELMRNNKLGLNGLLVSKKGTEIKYDI